MKVIEFASYKLKEDFIQVLSIGPFNDVYTINMVTGKQKVYDLCDLESKILEEFDPEKHMKELENKKLAWNSFQKE